MAEIGEVYGNNYQEQSECERVKYATKILGTNLAHKKFSIMYDSSSMWNQSNMKEVAIKQIISQVQGVNNKLRLTHVDKRTDKVNMFPYLINGPVEYFVLTNLDEAKMYSIFITPTMMAAL